MNSFNNLGPHAWKPYAYSPIGQHQWALENIIANHGRLGRYYPLRQGPSGDITYLDGGGIIPWLGLIHQGLSDIDQPHWGGWSGRYTSEKIKNVFSKHDNIRFDEEKKGDSYAYTEAADSWKDPETDTTYNDIYTPVWRWRRAMFNSINAGWTGV